MPTDQSLQTAVLRKMLSAGEAAGDVAISRAPFPPDKLIVSVDCEELLYVIPTSHQ